MTVQDPKQFREAFEAIPVFTEGLEIYTVTQMMPALVDALLLLVAQSPVPLNPSHKRILMWSNGDCFWKLLRTIRDVEALLCAPVEAFGLSCPALEEGKVFRASDLNALCETLRDLYEIYLGIYRRS